MTSWQTHYENRNWSEIENWWRDCDNPLDAAILFEWIKRDVPRIVRQNGVERIEDFVLPSEAPEEWKGAAKILYLGELEAFVEGDAPSAAEEWEKERSSIEDILSDFVEAEEVTKGDAVLSRRSHAARGIELLSEIDLEMSWLMGELDPEDRGWFAEAIAQTSHLAFLAGSHARSALGKDIEEHAIRGAQTRKNASRGGEERRRALQSTKHEIISMMKKLLASGHSVNAAATNAHQAGLGTSAAANRQLWYREREKEK